MAGNPYRQAGQEKCRCLTFREKAAAALEGMKSFEPLLEIASSGLRSRIPQEDKLAYAKRLSGSADTSRIFTHLLDEADRTVQSALADAFLAAFTRMARSLDNRCPRSYLAASIAANEKDRFLAVSRAQARTLLSSGFCVSDGARAKLEMLASGSAQV